MVPIGDRLRGSAQTERLASVVDRMNARTQTQPSRVKEKVYRCGEKLSRDLAFNASPEVDIEWRSIPA